MLSILASLGYLTSSGTAGSLGSSILADEWITWLWYIYTMEYYSAIKRNIFASILMRWMNLETVTQSEVSQKEENKYHILTHISGI